MKICTIIPCFNHADYVSNAVGSVFRQAVDADLSVIVVDDGSRDDSRAVLRGMSAEEPRLSVLHQSNAGAAQARNLALAAVPGDCDLVTFLDSDDILCPGRFAADVPHFAQDAALGFTIGRIRMVDALDYVSGQPTRAARRLEFYGPHLGAALFRRSFIEGIGTFDADFAQGEEVDFLFRAFEAKQKYLQTGTVCVNFLRHEGNLINNAPVARRGFLKALQHSVARRRRDPSIVARPAPFSMRSLADASFG
jgi:glycosyltransferase involved in cell wall biosynthesis